MIRRLEQGDEGALRDAIQLFGPAVFTRAWRLLHDPALAEEVTQDVFVDLWTRPSRFDPGRGSLSGLLLAIARNKAVDRIRHLEVRRDGDDRSGRQQSLEAAASDERDHTGEGVVRRHHVRAALEQLSELQREIIVLVYFGGRTVREVAEQLGIPEGTAKTRLRDALINLRKDQELP